MYSNEYIVTLSTYIEMNRSLSSFIYILKLINKFPNSNYTLVT